MIRVRSITAALALAAAAGAAHAQNTIELFGQTYTVQRFDYAQGITWPGLAFPSDTLSMVESEAFHYAGNGRFFISSDGIGDTFPGEAKNYVVEARFITDGLDIVGIEYVRTLIANDLAQGYNLNPAGLTVNPREVGLGAGGNLLVGSSSERIWGLSLQEPTFGQMLNVNTGEICPVPANACSLGIAFATIEVEDIVFVPGFGDLPDQIITVEEDGPYRAVRFSLTGQNIGSFPIARDVPGVNPFATPKGITYIPDVDTFPPALRSPGGVLVVALDNDWPGLQVFSLAGEQLGIESLTVDGTPEGLSRLELPGCVNQLALESIGCDPETGRLFLVNQGDGMDCNFLWVLTPVQGTPPCPADWNGDTVVNSSDLSAFITSWLDSVQNGNLLADFNGDNAVNSSDLSAFITAWLSAVQGGC